MSWRISVGFAVILSTGAVSPGGIPAWADEAYLCGPDKVVYVAVADLEAKKRSDPCIAAYYGLKVIEPAQPTPAVARDVFKPARKSPAKTAAPALKPTDAEIPNRLDRAQERQAWLEPPRAVSGTDFRNVRILNAAKLENAWFRHTK